jgi:hypothetical protein
MSQKQLSMDMIDLELLRNPAVVELLSVIGHYHMLPVIELLDRKFAFKDITYALEQGTYALEQGVIAFNRPNPGAEVTSNERAENSTVISRNTCCYHYVLKRYVKLTELGYRMLRYLQRTEGTSLNRD